MSKKMSALHRRIVKKSSAHDKPKIGGNVVVLSDDDFKTFMCILNSSEKPRIAPKLAKIKAAHDAMIAKNGGY